MIWRRRQCAFSERRRSTIGSGFSGGREQNTVVSIRAGAGVRQPAPLSVPQFSGATKETYRVSLSGDGSSEAPGRPTF